MRDMVQVEDMEFNEPEIIAIRNEMVKLEAVLKVGLSNLDEMDKYAQVAALHTVNMAIVIVADGLLALNIKLERMKQ